MGGADLRERPRSSYEFTHGHLLIRATGWPPYWPSALATGLSRGLRDQATTIERASPSVDSPMTVPATRFGCNAAIRDAAPGAGRAGSGRAGELRPPPLRARPRRHGSAGASPRGPPPRSPAARPGA